MSRIPKGKRRNKRDPTNAEIEAGAAKAAAVLARKFLALAAEHEDIVASAQAYCLSRWDGYQDWGAFVIWKSQRLALDHSAARKRRQALERELADQGEPEGEPEPEAEPEARQSRDLAPIGAVLDDWASAAQRDIGPVLAVCADSEALGWLAGWLKMHMTDEDGVLPRLAALGVRLALPADFDERLAAFLRRYARTGDGGWRESGELRPVGRRGVSQRDRARHEAQHQATAPARSEFGWRLERNAMARAIGAEALRLAGLGSVARKALMRGGRARAARAIDEWVRLALESATAAEKKAKQ